MLLTPGPVELHPEVLKSLSLPMIHHRTPEFDLLFKETLQHLKLIFNTSQDVFVFSSTGSGGMEALLVNTISPGEKVIVINSGKFGERWAKMASIYGANVITLDVPWGSSVRPESVKDLLKTHPDTRAVLCQACETSTAVAHPIMELGKIIHAYENTLFLVDGITALGAYPLPMDQWHIDGLVGGSQKAFMLPTGLSLLSFSEKAWPFVEKCRTPRFYFDVRLEKRANQSGETFFSSNVSLIRGLHVVLSLILKKGLDAHFQEIAQRARFVQNFSQKLGFTIYSQSPSPSVTALNVPPHLDSQKMRSYLEEQKKITVMGGQDQLKGKILRVGHMGYLQKSDHLKLIQSLGETLRHFDPHLLTEQHLDAVMASAQKHLLEINL